MGRRPAASHGDLTVPLSAPGIVPVPTTLAMPCCP